MFLDTNNELSEKEIKKTISVPSKKNNIFKNKFNQRRKDVYTENYKTLMKKLKKTQINGKISSVHGFEELIF